MLWLDSLLRSTVCVSCFCLMVLQLSISTGNNINSYEIVNSGNTSTMGNYVLPDQISDSFSNSSEEVHILPTPLLLHLNGSAVQLLIQKANNAFVSNTSFSDLVSDNQTHQMLLRYRERKRQERLLTIQRDILQMLGLTHGPNMTARLSVEERKSLVRSFGRTMVEHTNATNETACADTDDDFC